MEARYPSKAHNSLQVALDVGSNRMLNETIIIHRLLEEE